MDDLVERLEGGCVNAFEGTEFFCISESATDNLMKQAAARISALEALAEAVIDESEQPHLRKMARAALNETPVHE